MNSTIGYIRERGFDQTPLLIGARDKPVFAREDDFLSALRFAERRVRDPVPLETLQRRYWRLCARVAAPFPALHLAYGRAFLAEGPGGAAAAVRALEVALEQRGGDWPEARRSLIAAQLAARRDDEALRACEATGPELTRVAQAIERLRGVRRRAVLVGIRSYLDPGIPQAAGADDDARLVRKMIVERCGFAADGVTLLIDAGATRERVLAELDILAEAGRSEPALFFFAGHGSNDGAGAPTIVPADGRAVGAADIPIAELARRSAGAVELVSVIDAGWVRYAQTEPGTRSLPPAPIPGGAARGLAIAPGAAPGEAKQWRGLDAVGLKVGGLSIFHSRAIEKASADGGGAHRDRSRSRLGPTAIAGLCSPALPPCTVG